MNMDIRPEIRFGNGSQAAEADLGAEFIARVGGDEFLAVVLGSKTDAELAILAEDF